MWTICRFFGMGGRGHYARVGCGDERTVGDFHMSEGEREDVNAVVRVVS